MCLLVGASHYSAFIGNCPTISHMCQSYLPSRWVLYIFAPRVNQGNEGVGWA